MPEIHPFIGHLQSLVEKEERGQLAALRRGLGQPPGTVAAMYPIVVPWLPEGAATWREAPYYTVAALFALHPAPGGSGNLGTSFRLAEVNDRSNAAGEEHVPAIERRFSALLAAHPDDLPDCLRQAVGLLRSKDVAVDWNQLFSDIQHWGSPTHSVQRQWARAFWGRTQKNQTESEATKPDEEA
jgi:CRISPR system Cascade subunit CasB